MPISQFEPIDEKNFEVPKNPDHIGSKNTQETIPSVESIAEKSAEQKDYRKAYEKVLEKIKTNFPATAQSQSSITVDVDEVAQIEAAAKIDRLVNLAVEKGPEHAFRVAMKLDDFYALDKLHDNLIEKLYDSLIEKGFIKS